jgi:predicted Zn-dependent peptidase
LRHCWQRCRPDSGERADIDIQSVTSPGGITAWLVEDSTIPLIAMNFSFAGGAAVDPDDKAGLANFLSGMLDEGAGDLDSPAFQQRLDELSIRMSFRAQRDHFQGSLQTLSRPATKPSTCSSSPSRRRASMPSRWSGCAPDPAGNPPG